MLDLSIKNNALQDKVILVTGAGAGIGRQAALSYASQGATVILLGKTVKRLEQVFDQIIANGDPEPAIIPLDLKGATEQHYIDMADTIKQQCHRLDGILHNAGILGVLSPFDQIEKSTFDDVMQVNVTAPFIMTKALLPLLKQAPSASIIFTSGSVGKVGRAYWGAYSISKFATQGMMQTLADELEKTTVRANSINPGATRTQMRASAFPAEDASLLNTPEQIMAPYLFLMADESIEINGQSLDAQDYL